MVRLGRVSLGRGATLAVTLDGSEALTRIRKAKRAGARVLEIRIDRFRRLDENFILQKIRSYRSLGMPLIATIRSRAEGGDRAISEAKRLGLFKKVLPRVEAIDLELGSTHLVKWLVPLVHRKGKRAILSYHNFKATPSEAFLRKLVQEGRRRGADVVKIAVTPRSSIDVARLLLFTYRNREKDLISIAMGPRGLASRVLAPLFGSLLTYSFIGRPQAPGQLSVTKLSEEMKSFFRGFDQRRRRL